MDQANLFENREPLARSTDEATSYAAAAKLTESGKRSSQKAQILTFMRSHTSDLCTLTSAEIAEASMLQHPSVHKRLPDLRCDGYVRKGHPRKCSVTGNESVTWYAVPTRD